MDIKQIIAQAVYAQDYFPLTVAQWTVEPSLSAFSPEKIIRTLQAMERDYCIVISKKGKVLPFADSNLRRGILRSTTRGFAFVDCTDETGVTTTFFVSGSERGYALHEDKVLIRVLSLPKSDREGQAKVERILEHAVREVVGTLQKRPAHRRRQPPLWYLVPDDARIARAIDVVAQKGQVLRAGDKALLHVTLYPNAACPFQGKVVRVFGSAQSTDANYEAILFSHGVKTEFPRAVLAECDRAATLPITSDGRTDLRGCPHGVIFSMDGADAKDLDDAVSLCRTESGNFLLGVHIADVSEYVREGTATDAQALARGCSLYFVDQVVPMLPQSLSNGACSLNEGEDRYALSALMEIDKSGKTVRYEMHKSVIRSRLRGVYEEVNDVLARGEESAHYAKYQAVFADLQLFCELHAVLLARRQAGGMLELSTAEAKIHLDEAGRPVRIERRVLGLAEQIIEQCMLCANEAVATLCKSKNFPCVYRVHAAPSEEKLHTFSLFAHQCGLSLEGFPTEVEKLRPIHLRAVLEQAKEKGLGDAVSYVLLRSLSKAIYSNQSALHFGLGMEPYCHFTSPIRRYPDLCVHRILKEFYFDTPNDARRAHFATFAAQAAQQSTENELRALLAEREIEDLYKMLYLSEHIGERFDATISTLTSFGIFVALPNTCEGMIPLSSLEEYAIFDEATLTLRAGKHIFRLADPVTVELTEVDLDNRRATFALIRETDRKRKEHRYE